MRGQLERSAPSVAIAAFFAMMAGCAGSPPSAALASRGGGQTVALWVLARDPEAFRGRVVRTCGEQIYRTGRADDDPPGFRLQIRDPRGSYGFPAFINVKSCPSRRLRLFNGCVTGRIAREDGSLTTPEVVVIGSHQIGSEEWWLHPSCA